MNIQKINLFTPNNKVHLQEHKNQTQPQPRFSNLPMMAYRDYNISFGERLFRTPANFFEQDFNRQNMPLTMKKYLFSDYEDRQNMPPIQMLKLVFDDINLAKNLDEVQYLYPEEPLFEKLSDEPKIKARTGVIAEIEMMREEGKTLFKNGQDNLGFYILKKIYLEGKSLKEINNDFKKDISVHYNGLSSIQYDTLAAYGIRFPKNSFWKSFLATRQDFPYTYKPRKPIEDRITGHKGGNLRHENAIQKPQKKFEKIRDWQIDKLTNSMIEGNGNPEQTKRSLKKNSAGDPEALNFVAKYMGEINSVVLEKLHVSEEMKDFFENYENLSDSQKIKFKKYWENPDIKDLRSLVMSSTIRFFMDVYGVDGNNEEFKELLDYAHSIKPNRLKAQEEHNKLQAEYEEIFADYDADAALLKLKDTPEVEPEQIPESNISEETIEDKFNKKLKEHDGKVYRYELSNGTQIAIVGDYKNMLRKKIDVDMKYFPQSYRNEYYKHLLKYGSEYPKYFLSLFYNVEGLKEIHTIASNQTDDNCKEEDFELFKKEHMISREDVEQISIKITEEFNNKHKMQYRASDQIMNELLYNIQLTSDSYKKIIDESEKYITEKHPEISKKDCRSIAMKNVKKITDKYTGKKMFSLQITDLHKGLQLFGADPNILKPYIDKKYSIYTKPLNRKESQQIIKSILNTIENFNPSYCVVDNERSANIVKVIALNLKQYPQLKKAFAETLLDLNVIPAKHADYRAFLLNDTPKDILDAKAEIFIVNYLNNHPDALLPLLAASKSALENYILPIDAQLYREVMAYRMFQEYRMS